MRRFLLSCLMVFLLGGAHDAKAADDMAEGVSVTLRGLDKITTRITTFEVQRDREAEFGSLHITLRKCRKAPPEDPPEVVAFLEIDEQRPGDAERRRLFRGWMFASSPALSALEHPVYDVWVIDCKMVSGEGEAPAAPKSAE